MQLLGYLLIYPLIYLISRLPFRLLYILSDGVYILLYRIIGYRKKVVRENIKLALPELSDQERLQIEKDSYRHLCDMFLEMTKTMSMSQAEMEKRFQFTNLEVHHRLEKQGKSIALMCAHYGSYEWVISMNRQINYQGVAIYKKINNKYFDDLVKRIRGEFKAILVNNRDAVEYITVNELNNHHCIYGFASDQSPQLKKKTYWDTFMGIEVPVFTGAEYLSKKFDMSVVYLHVEKVKRGHYQATIEVLSENPREIPDYQITRMFLDRVEAQIRKAPQYYMWTHKRFKHMGMKNSIK